MAGQNNFYPYGESSTNILNNSEYQTDQERTAGAARGAIARSKIYNKALRQSAAGAYAVADLVAAAGKDADDANAATLAENFRAAVSYQARAFVATAVSVSGELATATVNELATTAKDDLPALFSLAMVLDQGLPAGASIKIASSLPDTDLTFPIYSGGEVLEDDVITAGAISLMIDTIGGKAFFRAGGMGKLPSDLAPLCPNFRLERNGGKIKIMADKIQLNPYTNMVQGGVWAWGKTRPVKPTGTNLKQWTRADLLTTGKPYDGLYLGDVTPSDAVAETIIWLPENNGGKIKLIPFIVLSTDYLGGVYVGRKNIIANGPGWFIYQSSIYDGSPHDEWYENTYFNSVLDSSVASQILEVDLPSGDSTIKRKVFGPSYTELYGQPGDGLWPTEGKTMPYFTGYGRLKAANDEGAAIGYAMRTTRNSNTQIGFVDNNGSITTPTSVNGYMRPGFILSKDMKIQQRPDGSYTIWDENGLQTLADIEPSSDVSAVYANITEGGKIVPTIFLNKEYSGTEGALLLRNDIYTNAAMSSATYQNSGADNTCTTWATAVVDEPYRAKMLDIEVKYYDVTKASVQTVPSKRKAFILGSQGLNVPGADTWPKYETTSPYFASDDRRKAPSGNVYWNRDKYSGNDAFSAYYYVSSTGSAGYENGANSKGIRPACVLGLDTAVRALADGTYDLVPDDPALSAQGVSTMAAAGTPVQLKDIPVSDASIKRTLILPEGENGQPFIYLSSNYNESGRGMMLREFTLPDSSDFSAFGVWRYDGSMVFQKIANWFDTLPSALKKWIEPINVHFRYATGYTSSSTFLNASVEAPAFLLTYKNMGYSAADSSYYGELMPYFTSDERRKAFIEGTETPATYWLVDAHSKYDAFNSGVYFYSIVTTGGVYRNDFREDPAYIRPAITLPLDVWFIDNGDDTYTFLGDAPTPDLSIEIDWPESDPLIARQWVYNTKGQYQTMLLGGVASTEDETMPEPDPVFGNNTPEQIKSAITQGIYKDLWSIGDEITIFADDGNYEFEIADFDHDPVSGESRTAPITLALKNLMSTPQKMNTGSFNTGSYAASLLHDYLTDTVYPSLPEEWKSIILSVDKKTSVGSSSTSIQTDSLNLFPFSEIELTGLSSNTVAGEGKQYPIFATASDRIKKMSNGTGSVNAWWTRSPQKSDNSNFIIVLGSGDTAANNAGGTYGVCFGFCIG